MHFFAFGLEALWNFVAVGRDAGGWLVELQLAHQK
jgi:hypothetical protein